MAIPKDVKIPKNSGQFMRFEDGANKFRVLSDVVLGWEGWKNNKPFRHEGEVCKIKPEQVDLNQNGRPNINYFWALVVWNYNEKRIQVLEIIQKTIMSPLYDLEQNEDWGDLKEYDITVNKKKEGERTVYTVAPSPHKPLTDEIKTAYLETDVKLEKLFEGEYPIEEDEVVEDVPF